MRLRIAHVILLLVLAASCTSRTGGTLTDKGNIIELTTKDHIVKAMKIAPDQGEYILLGANAVTEPQSLAYLDGRLIVMGREDFETIKSQYGDIKGKDSTGNVAARKKIRRLNVIAVDRPTQKIIRSFIDARMKRSRKHPLISLTMTELRVIDLKHQGKQVYLTGDVGKHYLVSKIQIVNEDTPL